MAKSFAVLVELVQKSSSNVVTSEWPFFYPGMSQKIAGLVTQPSVVSTTSISPVQATSFTATQPVEAPVQERRLLPNLLRLPWEGSHPPCSGFWS